MSSLFSRVRVDPYVSDSEYLPGALARAEADSAARAFAVGERRPTADPPQRRAPRRGDLPDVDFSQAVRVPRRSIWSRILAAFRANSSEALAAGETILEIGPASELTALPVDNVVQFHRAA